jgi:son of sevenless-like protein
MTRFLTEARILGVLSLWVEKHGMMQEDPQLLNQLRSFLTDIHIPPGSTVGAKQLLQTLDRKVGALIRQTILSDGH